MTSALFGSGATAAVIASHATAASSTFQESASIGAQTQINETITASATAIDNLPSQLTSSQVQTIYEAANSINPAVTLAITTSALSQADLTSTAKADLISNGISTPQTTYLDILAALEKAAGGGIIYVSNGRFHHSEHGLLDANCALYNVAVAGLAISGIFTGGITLGVVAGVTITWGMVFGAATVVGYLGAPYASC